MDKDIDAALARLTDHRRTAADLQASLERSLAIQQLWPEAFDHGKCTAAWVGKQRVAYKLAENSNRALHITCGCGEVQVFEFDKVPKILGGGK